MGAYGSEWESKGYCGRGSGGALINTLQGRPAIIAGNATGVFEQVHVAERERPDAVIFGVNDVGMYLPRMDHWVSLHADNLAPWRAVRWLHPGAKEDVRYHSIDPKPYVDVAWEGLTPLFCLSGYFAMQVAWMMGCAPIILCGCPGSPTPRFFERAPRADFGYGSGVQGSDTSVREQVEKEMRRVPEFKAAVRSMSGGWSSEYFGRP